MWISYLPILICLTLVAVCIVPLGTHMAKVYSGQATFLTPILSWLERAIYRVCGICPEEEMNWREYTIALMLFSLAGAAVVFILFSVQQVLPLNPQQVQNFSPHLAFNAAFSYISNTNWQSYSGETSLSYLSQMLGCTVQNFLSAATGMGVAVVLFRALGRKETRFLGNFWVDVVRCTLYILLPLSLVLAIFLVSQGVIQNLNPYTPYVTLENNIKGLIAQGPVASQTAIKILGSGGGGFFNVNAAHPFENPTALSNLVQSVAILLIPAALVYTFGIMVGDRRQGWALLAAMMLIFVPMLLVSVHAEVGGNPRFSPETIDQSAGNMEGKEVRIGTPASALWAVATTATSNGSVNAMHDSFTPIGSMVPLIFIEFGEVVFGGVGTGIHGILIYVVITVFLAGLMVGRTPEYLGKKLGALEIQVVSLCIILPAFCVLGGTAIAVSTEMGRSAIFNPGAQGFTEVMYAFASAGNNNGSALAGLATNTPFYNILLGICIITYRFGLIILLMILAGSLAAKNKMTKNVGTLSTHTPLFIVMLVVSILLLDVLTYVPSLAIGPLTEHMHLFGYGAQVAP